MAIRDELNAVENDPEFQALKASDPQKAAKLARFIARKSVEMGMAKRRDPEVTGFLQRNLPAVKGYKGTGMRAGVEIAREAREAVRGGTLLGAAFNRLTGKPAPEGPDVIGAYQQLVSGEYRPTAKEALLGASSALEATTGIIPDILAGTAASAAATPAIAARVAPRFVGPAIMAAESQIGGLMSGATAALQGRSPQEIAMQYGIGGLAGALGSYPAARAAQMAGQPPVSSMPSIDISRPQITRRAQTGPRSLPLPPEQAQIAARVASQRAQAEITQQQVRAGRRRLPAPPPPPPEPIQPLSTAARPIEIPPPAPRPEPMIPPGSAQRLAAESRIISPETAVVELRRATAMRVAAERRVSRITAKTKPEDAFLAQRNLEDALANERSALSLAEAVSARVESLQNRPIRLGAPQPPREPLALSEPSGPPLIPAQGMSEQALYGAPPGPPPIVTPPPVMRPQLPPPGGPEIMPPPAPIVPSAFALEGMAGKRPPGIPAGYTPSTALVPLPRPIEAYPPGYFLGQQVGERPPGMPLTSVLRPPLEPPPPMAPPSRQLNAPSGPAVMPEQLPPVTPMGQPPAAPSYVSQMPAPGAEEALTGRIMSAASLRDEAAAAAQRRFELQQQLDTLPALPEKPTRAQIAERTATELQIRQAMLDAGERQMAAMQRLSELGQPVAPPRVMGAPEPQPIVPPAAPAIAPRGKKKVQGLGDTPLGKLMLGEEGAATPEGALGALPVAASFVASNLGRLLRVTAPRIQKLGDAQSLLVDKIIGGLGGASIRTSGNLAIQVVDAVLARGGAAPNTARRMVNNAINAIPGKSYAEKVDGLRGILKHSPSNTGVPAIDNLLNWPRRLFVTNYGLSPEAVAVKEEAERAAIRAVNPVAEWLNRAIAERTDAEMVDLYRGIENPNYTGSDPLVLEYKGIVSKLEESLKDLGVITKEQFDRFNDTYMPREYALYFWTDPEVKETTRALFRATNDKTLKGWYGRGLTQQMTRKEFAEANARGEGWREIGKPRKGDVVYAWRDYTKDERAKFGEIEHAGRQITKYGFETLDRFRRGALLDGYSKGRDSNGAFSLAESDVFAPAPGVKRPDVYVDPSTNQKYIYLEGKVDRGINKLGNLAGRYVRDDIAHYVMSTAELGDNMLGGITGSLLSASEGVQKAFHQKFWKRIFTTGNFPGYLVNNFLFNPVKLVIDGGSMADLPQALVMSMDNSDEVIKYLTSVGTIKNGRALSEAAARLQPVLSRLANDLPNPNVLTNETWARAVDASMAIAANPKKALEIMRNAAAKTAFYTTELVGAAAKKVENMANATDDLYRVALVIGLMRRQNMTIEQAARVAEKSFYNAKNINSVGTKILEGGIPFVKVGVYTIDEYPAAIAKNPHRALYLSLFGSSLPFIAAAIGGSKGDTVAERIENYKATQKLLPKRMQNAAIELGVPKSIPAGADEAGNPRFIDLSNIAVSGLFEPVEGLGNIVPRMFSPGGFQTALAQYVFNKDIWTNKPIALEGPLGEEVYNYRADFLKRQLMPPTFRNISEFAKSSEVFPDYVPFLGGAPSRGGEFLPGTQLARMAGFKLTPIDVEKNARITLGQYDNQIKLERQQFNVTRRKLNEAIELGNERAVERLTLEAEKRAEKIREYAARKQLMAEMLMPALQQDEIPLMEDALSEPSEMMGRVR